MSFLNEMLEAVGLISYDGRMLERSIRDLQTGHVHEPLTNWSLYIRNVKPSQHTNDSKLQTKYKPRTIEFKTIHAAISAKEERGSQ